MITLSIVIPTMGRDTLARTLRSLGPQLEPGDEVLLACDGLAAYRKAFDAVTPLACRHHVAYRVDDTIPAMKENPGGTQRNAALAPGLVGGDYLLWCGDDDIYLPGALDAVRTHAEANPGRPLMFRMITPCGAHPWQEEDRGRIERHYVGDHMFVAPNVPALLGRFGPTYSGDYDFIRHTLDLYTPFADGPTYQGEDCLVWCPETLAHCRPERK